MKEQTGSRKKYLAPLVVLMLCLVALTGAAYAYSTSVTSVNTQANADYFSIDLYNNTGATVADGPFAESVCAATFTTALVKSTNKVTVTANSTPTVVAHAYVKVMQNVAGVDTCNLTLTPSEPITCTGILAGLTVTVAVDEVTVGGESVTPAAGVYEVATGALVTITLKATLGGITSWEKDIGTGEGKYANALAAAQAFANEFHAQALYALTASAEPVTA